ncbi:MAG: hypothetical protein U0871_01380 [Gemmataceae bacterium]
MPEKHTHYSPRKETAMQFEDLIPRTRALMAEELDCDMASGTLYLSDRLSDAGRRDYPRLLAEALTAHEPGWLEAQLREGGRLSDTESYTRSGVTRERRVPATAAATLAEGEYNRFYCRAVCRLAAEAGPAAEVEVYRAKPVSSPRPESEAKIGTRVNAAGLLADLRWNKGVDTALGVPAGPNSGLSVRLVRGGETRLAAASKK